VERVKDFCPILFALIEANRGKIFARNTPEVHFKLGIKSIRGLKRLDYSFDYDKKRGRSNRAKGKVRGSICAMKPKIVAWKC
jgi:hypothetical protein